MKTLPIYCPLRSEFTFEAEELIREIDALVLQSVQERSLPFENGKSIYDQEGHLKIASDEVLNSATKYSIDEDGNRVPVKGALKTYHVTNLTYLEEEPESLTDIYRRDSVSKSIFWHTYKKPFTWRTELHDSAIKKSVEQFPWEYVQGVRLIYMSPPSVGQVHRDSHPVANHRYYREGFASITFNIAHGGGVMHYLDKEQSIPVDNNVKVFHFNDSVPHGVTPISSPRYQLRMWGKLKVPYEDLFYVQTNS